jgi:phage terminase large subunit GpA-like protein
MVATDSWAVKLWADAARRARWPEKLLPSEWIERNLIIPANSFNPEPGPYHFDRTPYWREVIDSAADPVVKEVWVYKANQTGFTQLMLAWAGYCAAQDPGAMGILLPDEDSIDELFGEELKPLILATPTLRALRSGRSWDETKHEFWLTSMPILGLYAGSLSKLEKRKLRYTVGDEINLYRDATPLQKLLVRMTTWGHKAKAFFGSKPTTADGNITKGYESCPDKRRFLMPCPRCGRYHEWLWHNVKGFRDAPGDDKYERANWVKINKPAFYECDSCHGRVEESERMACVRAGRWVSGTGTIKEWKPVQTVGESGVVKGERPASERIGFWVWSIVSPWTSMSMLAAEFVEAEGDHDRTRTFQNSRRALPWDEVVRSVRPSLVRDKKALAGPPLIVPKWAVVLVSSFDTQKDWFAGTIRAWGYGYRSTLVWHGECQTFDEVYKIGLESRFAIEGGSEVATPKALVIDSGGNRTSEVYEFCLRDPARLISFKGGSHQMRKPWTVTTLPNTLRLIVFDPNHYKDFLARLMSDPDPTKWMPHAEVSEQYCLEMASEHKIKDPKTKRDIWTPTGAARREAWDCEVQQVVAADIENLGMQVPEAVEPRQQAASKPSVRPDWMPERPESWVNR